MQILKDLRKISSGATPKEWNTFKYYATQNKDLTMLAVESIEFISAFSPDLIDKMLNIIEAAESLFNLCEHDLSMDKTELTMMRKALSELKGIKDEL